MAEGEAPARKARLLFILRLVLTALALLIIGRIAWNGRAAFAGAGVWDPRRIAAAIACAPLILSLRILKWRVLLRTCDARIGFREALRSYLGCLPWGMVTPGRVGEFSRGLYLPPGPARSGAAGRVLLDNWTDMQGALLWCALGGAALAGAAGAALGIAACLALAPVRFWMRLAEGGLDRLPRWRGLRDLLAKAVPDPQGLRPAPLAGAVFLAGSAWGLEWAQMDLLLRGMGAEPGAFWKVAGLMSLAALANSIQVTLGGLGVKEGAAAFLLARAGVPAAAAVPAGIVQTGLNVLLPALAGLLIPRDGRDAEEPLG